MSSMSDAREVMDATGLKMAGVKEIPHSGEDFSAYKAAQKFLEEQGYTVGIMCHPQPTAAAKGLNYIAKWYNIKLDEWPGIQAMIVGDDYRDGACTVVFFKEA